MLHSSLHSHCPLNKYLLNKMISKRGRCEFTSDPILPLAIPADLAFCFKHESPFADV